MDAFTYTHAERPADAVRLGSQPGSRFIAGGTDLLNLMKENVQRHDRLIDINPLPLDHIRQTGDRVELGALARMSDVAAHPLVRSSLPMLSQALLASASPQVRNMASLGGNLMQRTRCWYFRDDTMPCNKREPGTGCPAIQGQNRWHAVLGGSEHCVAVHPSDLAVALTAYGATVHTATADGTRSIPVGDFYQLPGATPHLETVLSDGELITGIDVPVPPPVVASRYVKVRDRATFEFAVVSVAAVVEIRHGTVRSARLAFGGIGTRPWRSAEAEEALIGRPLADATIAAAGRALTRAAVPREHNAFKIPLVERTLADTLRSIGGRR